MNAHHRPEGGPPTITPTLALPRRGGGNKFFRSGALAAIPLGKGGGGKGRGVLFAVHYSLHSHDKIRP